jgi:hypothetical protein
MAKIFLVHGEECFANALRIQNQGFEDIVVPE